MAQNLFSPREKSDGLLQNFPLPAKSRPLYLQDGAFAPSRCKPLLAGVEIYEEEILTRHNVECQNRLQENTKICIVYRCVEPRSLQLKPLNQMV